MYLVSNLPGSATDYKPFCRLFSFLFSIHMLLCFRCGESMNIKELFSSFYYQAIEQLDLCINIYTELDLAACFNNNISRLEESNSY